MLVESVRGKNILFISPEFFGIDKNIISVLKENGANVIWYDERSVKSSFGRAINSICPQVFIHQSNKYYSGILEKIRQPVDTILVIKGEMISKQTISLMRSKFPNAELLLYLYDPVKNIKGILEKTTLYDRVISFEPDDCKKFGFEFRPLFCSIERDYEENSCQIENDICFYGTMYGDRFEIVEAMKSYCQKHDIRFYSFCFLRGKFMEVYYYLTNNGFRKLGLRAISLKPKSMKEIAHIVSRAVAIFDINDINQKGLTNRTLETLISGKKLITTNESIKEYDLYNENNVFVVKRKNISFPYSFLTTECVKLPKTTVEKYTAEGWVKDVFR